MEKFFKLKENHTTVGTEFIAGLTTFLTMAYILFVNPSILKIAGMNEQAVFIATALASVIGTLVMGLVANVPFALAPGMGLNAMFTFTVVLVMGFTWQQALAIVFICGLINILITVTNIRKTLMKAIPVSLQHAISGGIGMFIFYIGLINAGFLKFSTSGTDLGGGSFSAIIPSLQSFTRPDSLIALAGLIIIIVLMLRKIKGAILIGIAFSTILALLTKVISLPTSGLSAPDFSVLGETFLKLDFAGLFGNAEKLPLAIVTIIAFSLTDTFDTIGTFLGTGRRAGIFDEADEKRFGETSGFSSKLDKALFADATATSIGALLGTSNTTTYVESAAGISEGGRTGLTAVFTAIFFILSLLLLPIVGVVPGFATAPALIVVGILMAASIKDIAWDDFSEAVPAFFTMAMMPLAYSITTGVTFGFLFFCISKIVTGKAKDVHPIMYIFTGLFILSFILQAVVH